MSPQNERPVFAVIMAGGPGERLWPLSRPGRPKPLIEVQGETLLHRAYRRAVMITGDPDHVLLIAREADRGQFLQALPELPKQNFLGEPLRRDTAMAVLTAAHVVFNKRDDASIIVLPADHVVEQEDAFTDSLSVGLSTVAEDAGICLMGERPTEPKTQYGYIISEATVAKARRVLQFVEKPAPTQASLLIERDALWNMGVFIASVGSLLTNAKETAPDIWRQACSAADAFAAGQRADLLGAYEEVRKISFDRAVLEAANELHVVPCSCGWTDLGTWREFAAFHRRTAPEQFGDQFVWNEPDAPPLQLVGVPDVLICNTSVGALVADLDASDKVRPPEQASPRPPVPQGATVIEKPWGAEYIWANTERYAGKLLWVRAGESLSVQYHERKVESMWVIAGHGVLIVDGQPQAIAAGSTITLYPQTIHQLQAWDDLSVIEVSTPDLDDVVRVSDRYGRAPQEPTA